MYEVTQCEWASSSYELKEPKVPNSVSSISSIPYSRVHTSKRYLHYTSHVAGLTQTATLITCIKTIKPEISIFNNITCIVVQYTFLYIWWQLKAETCSCWFPVINICRVRWVIIGFHIPRALTFRHRASCILGQAFHYSPENAFYIFNQQIYFIIWYLLDRASLI